MVAYSYKCPIAIRSITLVITTSLTHTRVLTAIICAKLLDNIGNIGYNTYTVLGGELAVPYNSQSATARLKAVFGY